MASDSDRLDAMSSSPLDSRLGTLTKECSLYDLQLKKFKATLYANYIKLHHRKAIVKSKEKSKEKGHMYIPCALLWLRKSNSPVSSGKSKKTFTSLTLLGPEFELTVLTTEKEDSFWDAVKKSIKQSRLDAGDGYFTQKDLEKKESVQFLRASVNNMASTQNEDIRTGSYQFEDGGLYRGDWMNARAHGEGTYLIGNDDYTGWWNGIVKAGCGDYYSKSGGNMTKKEGGWVVDFSSGMKVKMVVAESGLSDNTKSGLLDEDVKLFHKFAKTEAYEKNEVILAQGSVNTKLYWIQSGTLAITMNKNGIEKNVGTMSEQTFFGELSVLDKAVTSATVKAASEKVVLLSLPLETLLNLFETHPGLSKRFHTKIAISLAGRVRNTNKTEQQTTSPSPTSKWGLVKKSIAVSSMLNTFAFQESSLRADHAEGYENETEIQHLVRKWLALWSQKNSSFQKCISSTCTYLDPFVPSGLRGAKISEHISSLFEKHPDWKWQVVEFFPSASHSRATVRLRLLSPALRVRVWTILVVTMKHHKLSLIELFYDRAPLLPEFQGNRTEAMSPRLSDPNAFAFTERDLEFRKRFNISSYGATVIADYAATLYIHGVMENHTGRLYFSENYMCFGSRVFGLDLKKVVPLSKIKSVVRTQKSVQVQMISEGVESSPVYDIFFEDVSVAETATAQLTSLREHNVTSSGGSEESAQASTIQKFLHANNLHAKLPTEKLFPATSPKGTRVVGPRSDEGGVSIGDYVYGRSISNYPHWSTFDKNKKVVIDENKRQGDPICDQFVVESFPNQTIFAVADGCNWGWKPRNAAFAASRRFVEYIESQQTGLLSVRSASKIFLQGFHWAHDAIMAGNEKNWWDVGTTTLIGGALMQSQDPEFPWMFVAGGVGDCKAFHFAIKGNSFTVDEITIGSRSGENITDAADCGGRLGPHIKGEPDLRNLDTWYRPLQQNDLVMVCSDGVHDNLDPQHLGKLPSDFGLEGEDWEKADAAAVEKVKQKFAHELLLKFMGEIMAKHNIANPVDVPLKELTDHIIAFCYATSKTSREFMEQHPDLPQPHDYVKYPGKMDHTTCVFIRAQKNSNTELERSLDSLVVRMRNPISGIPLKSSTTSTKKGSTGSDQYFAGKDIVDWVRTSARGLSHDDAETSCQHLLSYRYIRPLGGFKTLLRDSFSADTSYEFQVYQPIMTQGDWKNLLSVAIIQKFRPGDAIIKEGERSDGIFQIIKGRCKVVKQGKDKSNSKELATMAEADIFGELNVLEKRPASASVVAATFVEVYSLRENLLKMLWAVDPGLEGRFFHFIASTLARRLKRAETM